MLLGCYLDIDYRDCFYKRQHSYTLYASLVWAFVHRFSALETIDGKIPPPPPPFNFPLLISSKKYLLLKFPLLFNAFVDQIFLTYKNCINIELKVHFVHVGQYKYLVSLLI